MGVNAKCPKCGSTNVQLSNVQGKHGCFWLLMFGWLYVIWVPIKWLIGLVVLVCFDWWMALIQSKQNKGYVWRSKGWFSGVKKVCYCHDCGHNFKAS